MNDIAHLNMAVDSTDTDKAAKSLDNLADFAEKAEKATGALGQAVQKNAKEYKSLSDMADDLAKSEKKAIQQMHERARAQTKSMSAGVAAMQATEKSAQSMSQYAAETEKLRAGLTKLLTAIDPLEARLNKLDEAEKRLTETFKRGIIDVEKYAESLAKIGAQRDKISENQLEEISDGAEYASEMMDRLGLSTRRTQIDLMNLARAATEGSLPEVRNYLFQLLRNSTALRGAMSGLGVTAGAAAAGVALLGIAYYNGYQRTQEFNRSIALTGNVLGVSASEMAHMTTEVGRLSGSYAHAEQAANLIVRSGRIASDSIQDVMQTAVEMQQTFGQSVDETISEFERLGVAPSRTLIELDEKYRFLTAAVLEQVLALERQGRMEEAMAIAQADYSRALGERAKEVIENVGVMEKAWQGLKGVVTGTWETMLNIGRAQSVVAELADINEAIALLEKGEESLNKLKSGFAGGYVASVSGAGMAQVTGGANIEALYQRRAELEETLKLQEEEAKAEARDREIEDLKKERLKLRNSYLETYTKSTLASELAKANEELKQVTAGLDKESAEYAKVMEAHYNRVEQINKKYEKSTRSGGASGNQFAAEVARLKARIAEERDLSKAVEETITQVTRLNQFERKAMQLREQASKETKAGTKAQLEKLAALNEEAGALVRNNKLAEEAAKERLRYLEGLEKSTKSTYDEAQKLRDQAQTMGMSRMALEALTTARLEDQVAQLKGKEGSEEEIKLLREQIAARHKLSDAIGQHEMARASYEAQQELGRDWQKTVDNIDDVFRRGFADMLNEGKGSWNSFTKSLTTTFKTAVADQIYKMFMQPFVAQVAVGLTGGLGMGGANAGQQNVAAGFDVLRTANTAYSAFTGGLTSSLSKGVGLLGEKFGSSALSSFSAGMAGTVGGVTGALSGTALASSGVAGLASIGSGAAATLGSSVGVGAIANPAFAASVGGGSLGGMAGAGAALGAAMPWITGGLAIAALIPSIANAFKGEMRSGGGFIHNVAANQTQFAGGPSGGYGGAEGLNAVDSVLKGFAGTVMGVINGLDIAGVELNNTIGTFEGSKKGRGGTSTGGSLIIDGHEVYFGSVGPQGQGSKGSGYGGKNGSAEEMFANMAKDMAFSTLEAWQLVADKMPVMIQDMLSDVHVRDLAVERAEAMVAEITGIVGSVNVLTQTLHELPFDNLRDLSFEAAAGLLEMAGGTDALLNSMGVYYSNFYTDAERGQQALEQLSATFGELNVAMPMSRQGFRELVDGIDVSTESGQKLYASLMQMSGAAAGFYDFIEAQSSAAFESVAADLQKSHNEYLNSLRERHQAQMQAIRDEYQQRNQALRDSLSEITSKMRDLSQIAQTLESSISSLRQQSSMAESLYRESGRRIVDDALLAGRAGKSLANFDGLTDAVRAVSQLNTGSFANQFEFELERAESIAALKELEGLTGTQIDVQQMQADLLEKQIENLVKWRDSQLEQLSNQFQIQQELAQEHFEKEMEAARERFNKEMQLELEAQEKQLLINGSIEQGADSTMRGLSFVESAINRSAERIAGAVSNIRVNVSMPSGDGLGFRMPAFADGGSYRGGLALVGERGPEIINFDKPAMIYSNAQSKNLIANAGVGNGEVTALLRQLIGEIKEMRCELRQVALNTQQTNGMLNDVTQGGTELRMKEVKA